MQKIKIIVKNTVNNGQTPIAVPDELTGQEVIDALLKESKIPKLDDYGNAIDWKLVNKHVNSQEAINKKKLKDAGVVEGAQLLAVANMVAAFI